MVRVICTGIAVWDEIFSVPAIPDRPAKFFADDYRGIGGGPASTASVAVVAMAGEALIWARVGDDPVAGQITSELAGLGVDVSDLHRVEGARSGLSAVVVDKAGERLTINYADKALTTDPGWLPLDKLDEADAVLCDCRWPAGAEAVLRKARDLGKISLLDGDLTPDFAVRGLSPLASHVAFSHGGLSQFTGIEDAREGLAKAGEMIDSWVCVTLGAEGCLVLDGDEVRHVPAFAVEVKDTTGAGDVFHGALAVGLAEGMTDLEAVRFSCAAAALKCTRFGGRAGMPSRAEVEAFLRKAAD